MKEDKFFFEIPIYRCTQEKFNTDYDRELNKHLDTLWPNGARYRLPKNSVESAKQDFWERYGAPWNFNQAVGWLRLFVTGSQIRADLWFTNAKRLLRRPKYRQISIMGKGFEITFESKNSSIEIYEALLNRLLEFENSFHGGRLNVDLECFKNIGLYVNWRALIGFDSR